MKIYFLQDDWLDGLILLCERTLDYFKDESQYKVDNYYPTENKIKKDLIYFEKQFKKDGLEGLNDLQKIWGYEVKDKLPDYAEIEMRINNNWERYRKRQIDFLNMFLEKYVI